MHVSNCSIIIAFLMMATVLKNNLHFAYHVTCLWFICQEIQHCHYLALHTNHDTALTVRLF
jgi:hypothetical protein